MRLADRLHQWWGRLRGVAPPTATPVPAAADRGGSPTTRPVTTLNETNGVLELVEEGEPDRKTAKRSSAGFDPYSSDAGFSKPRGWDNVNRK